MSEHFSALIALDRRLLLTRFELAVEALLPIAPSLESISLPPNPQKRALIEWIETAERLVATGVFERYPEHVRRHARALPAIVADTTTSGEELAEAESRVRMFFGSETIAEDVLDLGDGLSLRKTRRRDVDNVEDWSALDALCNLTDAAVEQLSSGHPYRRAICAYRLGRFHECHDALVCCLDEDNDVREYWLLLAFTERHLGNFEKFERIVFEDEVERPS